MTDEFIVVPGTSKLLNARSGRNTQTDDALDEVVTISGHLAGPHLDAFGRQRVSDPVTLFDSQHQYDKQPLLWDESTTGSGASAHAPNESSVDLTNTTASGDEVIRQTRSYHRYQPGKSQLILTTFVMGDADSNVRMRVGYFDADNGLFLERDGATINLVRRTKASGVVVDNKVAQADWNLDTLDGSGISGVTLDLSKAQIFAVDFEWLGVGTVNAAFVIDGVVVPVHQFRHANSLSTVYMTTANLPVRYEVTNTGTAGAAPTLKQICCSVISEGGLEEDRGLPRCTSNGTTTRAVSTILPVIAIRPAATFNSIENRSQVNLGSIDLFSEDEAVYVEVVYNPTVTGGSWVAVPDSVLEVNKAATSISGGILISAQYVAAASVGSNANPGAGKFPLLSRLPLTLDIAGANPIPLAVMVTSIPGAASDCSAAVFWREYR